jgi:hairy-and-enhancer-of-split protein
LTYEFFLFELQVTKPLLERQRRARINRCLDELKDILVAGLQNEGENVARLEKADILELTVRHLQKLQQQHNKLVKSQQMVGDDERFRNGFAHCAQEVSRVLATTRGVDIQLGSSIMIHLGHSLNQITSVPKKSTTSTTTPTAPPSPKMMMAPRPSSVCSNVSSNASSTGEYRPYTPPASPSESQFSQLSPLSLTTNTESKIVWRPW